MKEKLKELDIRLTELAEYLNISRPTLYKFVDYYSLNKRDLINKKALLVLDYISSDDCSTKRDVISFIINNTNDNNNNLIDTLVKQSIDISLQELIISLIQHNEFYFLYDTINLLFKDGIDTNNLRDNVGQLIICIENIRNNKKLTEKQFKAIKLLKGDNLYGKVFKN